MTTKKAIEIINTTIEEFGWNFPLDYIFAFEGAKKALEKQTPKKPISTQTDEYPHILYCRSCGFIIALNKEIEDFLKSSEKYNYCPGCGQALDWERS